jgi:hypothetical protein
MTRVGLQVSLNVFPGVPENAILEQVHEVSSFKEQRRQDCPRRHRRSL